MIIHVETKLTRRAECRPEVNDAGLPGSETVSVSPPIIHHTQYISLS